MRIVLFNNKISDSWAFVLFYYISNVFFVRNEWVHLLKTLQEGPKKETYFSIAVKTKPKPNWKNVWQHFIVLVLELSNLSSFLSANYSFIKT